MENNNISGSVQRNFSKEYYQKQNTHDIREKAAFDYKTCTF